MSRLQLPSSSGLRMDGRRHGECRRVTCGMGVFHRAVDGSASFELGQTKVLAAVYGPREADRWGTTKHDRAILSVEFTMSKFSGSERVKWSKGGRRSTIMENTLRQVFEPVIQMHLFPRSEVSIIVEIVQNDGGILPASINCITLALIDAGIPIDDYVCACSAGFIDTTPVLDLSWVERSVNGVEACVAMLPVTGKVSLAEMESTLLADHFGTLMTAAIDGCRQMHKAMKDYVRQHALNLLQVDEAGGHRQS
ncbi:3' exoribonuclease family, domain 1 containing protein [Plasmodiophora brassicae]